MQIAPYNASSLFSERLRGFGIGIFILDTIEKTSSANIVKKASQNKDAGVEALYLIVAILDRIGVATNVKKAENLDLVREAAVKPKHSDVRRQEVKIASKRVADSHYSFDIGLEPIKRKGKSLLMASCFLKDEYLGRYLIKRNFFYLPGNEVAAETTFDEITRKAERYANETIASTSVLPEVKSFLDGIRGDFEFVEDSNVGTPIYTDRENGHVMNGPYYAGGKVG